MLHYLRLPEIQFHAKIRNKYPTQMQKNLRPQLNDEATQNNVFIKLGMATQSGSCIHTSSTYTTKMKT